MNLKKIAQIFFIVFILSMIILTTLNFEGYGGKVYGNEYSNWDKADNESRIGMYLEEECFGHKEYVTNIEKKFFSYEIREFIDESWEDVIYFSNNIIINKIELKGGYYDFECNEECKDKNKCDLILKKCRKYIDLKSLDVEILEYNNDNIPIIKLNYPYPIILFGNMTYTKLDAYLCGGIKDE